MYRIASSVMLSSYAILLKMLSHVSITPLIGSKVLFASTLAPLVGYFVSSSTCVAFYLLRTVLLLGSNFSLGSCLIYLPTLAGSVALASHSKVYVTGISLTCIVLFALHPTGQASYLYACYWLIPLMLSWFLNHIVFARALISTFITHAVGSTIYLYSNHTDALFWHALIPQVWVERVVQAAVLTFCYYAFTGIIQSINQQNAKGVLCLEQ